MYELNSQTVSDTEKGIDVTPMEWKFQIENGNTGELTISDVMLDTEALAIERSNSEFLKNSYEEKEIFISTYRTDLTKNMIINVYGLPYIVKTISTVVTPISIISNIKAIRYD